ncbi:hypothetical protein EP7_005616 (plasmid) [Isosphaeraceae bacterium EP7]
MLLKKNLDDPDYRALREVINDLISAASWLSGFTFIFMLATNRELLDVIRSEPSDKDVLIARQNVGLCIADYLLRMTLFGRIIWTLASLLKFGADLKGYVGGQAIRLIRTNAFALRGNEHDTTPTLLHQ